MFLKRNNKDTVRRVVIYKVGVGRTVGRIQVAVNYCQYSCAGFTSGFTGVHYRENNIVMLIIEEYVAKPCMNRDDNTS